MKFGVGDPYYKIKVAENSSYWWSSVLK